MTAENDPPVAADDAASTLEDTPVDIDVLPNDTDPEDNIDPASLAIAAQPSEGTAALTPENTIIYEPNEDFNGEDAFTYTVEDDLGAVSNEATVTVTVTAENDPPTLEVVSPNETQELVELTLTTVTDDPDGDTLYYDWTQPDSQDIVLGDTEASSLTFTTPYVGPGGTSIEFTLTVRDRESITDKDVRVAVANISITVTDYMNYPPIAKAKADNYGPYEGKLVTLNDDGSDDPDGDEIVSFRWTQIKLADEPDVELMNDDTKESTFIAPPVSENETVRLRLIVNDGQIDSGITDSSIMDIQILNKTSNFIAPEVTDIPNQQIDELSDGSQSFDTINLDDYVTDPDTPKADIDWAYSGNTDLAVDITDRVATITAPSGDWSGTESITFTATDPEGGTDFDSADFTVTSTDNDPPVISDIPDQTVNEGESFDQIMLDNYVTDPDNDVTTEINWGYSGNTGLAVDITGRVATITAPNPDWIGQETITFTAEDPNNGSDSDEATFTVVNIDNDPPVADAGAPQTVEELDPVTLDGNGSEDPEDARLTYQWSQTAGPSVDITGAQTAQPTFTAPGVTAQTVLTFQLIVNDGAQDSSPDTVDITVNNLGAIPENGTVTPDDGKVSFGHEITITTTHSDADGWEDLKWASLKFESASNGKSLLFNYARDLDKLYIWDEDVDNGDGSRGGWIGGAAPNEQVDIDYKYCVLHCEDTQVSGNGDVMTVAWSITFKEEFIGEYDTYLVTGDMSLLAAPWEIKGAFEVVENLSPIADAGDDQAVEPGETVTLDGTGSSDPDGDTLYYSWAQEIVGDETIVTLSDDTAQSPAFEMPAEAPGTILRFILTVSDREDPNDPERLTDTDVVDVSMRDDEAPIITINNEASIDGSIVSRAVITLSGTIADNVEVSTATIEISPQELLPPDSATELNLDENGEFEVTVNLDEYNNNIVINAEDSSGNESSKSVSIQLFTLILHADPTSGTAPLEVEFEAETSADRRIIAYEWDFDGNGIYDWRSNFSNEAEYIYRSAGTYPAIVRVVDEDGNYNTASLLNDVDGINVMPDDGKSPHIIEVAANVYSGQAPLTVEFSGTAEDPDGNIALYEWDFEGDGIYDSRSEASARVVKTYYRGDVYTATLRVTDDNGRTATGGFDVSGAYDSTKGMILIDVTGHPGAPDIVTITSSRIGGMPLDVSFSADISGGAPVRYEWDFDGDGVVDGVTTSHEVTVAYSRAGIFTASCVAIDKRGLADRIEATFTITETPPDGIFPASLGKVEGPVPVIVDFDSVAGDIVDIQEYSIDFEGDGFFDARSPSLENITHTYHLPGRYRARVLLTHASGWKNTLTLHVKAERSQQGTVYLLTPQDGKTVAGSKVTIAAHADGRTRHRIQSLVFQYRTDADTGWNDVGDPVNGRPYKARWDTTGLDEGVSYKLRVLANLTNPGGSSAELTSDPIEVNIDNSPGRDADIDEGVDPETGQNAIKQRVRPERTDEVILGETEVTFPHPYIIPTETTLEVKNVDPTAVSEPVSYPAEDSEVIPVDVYRDITLSSQSGAALSNYAGIRVSYKGHESEDLDESTFKLYYFDAGTGVWEMTNDSIVYPDEYVVTAETNHFSLFGLGAEGDDEGGGTAGSGSGSGGGGSGGGGGRDCFIATAAYGTPMAGEIGILCRFRDERLLKNRFGREFVRFYYRNSPPVADYISNRPALRAFVRALLRPIVWVARRINNVGGE